MGKTDKMRPPQISREEEELRWQLATGKITFDQFERRYKKLKAENKIYRRPRYKLNKATGE